MPVVNGQLLDLVALLGAITKRGGVRRVQDQSLWNEVMFRVCRYNSSSRRSANRKSFHETTLP